MGQMLVRKLDDAVIERIKTTAEAQGKSAEQVVRDALKAAFRPSREEIVQRMDALRARSKPVDLATAMRFQEEARMERDSYPELELPIERSDDR